MLDFAILGLPGSRTAWCSAFFTTDLVHCHHEWSAGVNQPDDFLGAMVPGKVSGIADTAAFLLGDDLTKYVKRVVVIHRDREQCEASVIRRFGAYVDLGWVESALAKVEGLHIAYEDLQNLETVKGLWEYCTQSPFKPERYAAFKDLRIETMVDYFKPLPGSWVTSETRKCLLSQVQ